MDGGYSPVQWGLDIPIDVGACRTGRRRIEFSGYGGKKSSEDDCNVTAPLRCLVTRANARPLQYGVPFNSGTAGAAPQVRQGVLFNGLVSNCSRIPAAV
jgi:hypothetical protein